MKFTVTSGNYKAILNSNSHSNAAKEAMLLWKCKQKKPDLAQLTTVVGSKKTVYLSTSFLIDET